MATSVFGNSCRANKCCTPPNQGCLVRVSGECAYYSGARIVAPGINTSDTLNTVVIKIIDYINNQITTLPSIIPITSADFEHDGVTYINSALSGVEFEIFLNDLNRFIYNEVGNQEWDYRVGGGFQISLSGFDANTNDYHLYLFPKT